MGKIADCHPSAKSVKPAINSLCMPRLCRGTISLPCKELFVFAAQGDEGVVVGVAVVGAMVFALLFFPLLVVDDGEIGVAALEAGVNQREVQRVDTVDRRAVNLLTANDKHRLGHRGKFESLLGRVRHDGTLGLIVGLARNHNVLAAGQGTFRKRLKGATTHDDAVAHGQRLEVLQVGREVAQQLALAAYGVVGCYGDDGGDVLVVTHDAKDKVIVTPTPRP